MPERRRRADRYEHLTQEVEAETLRLTEAEKADNRQPDAIPSARTVLATNTGVRLACTMAAMIGLFAIFLCWAEKESRVIRRFSVQSACLSAIHGAVGASALLISSLLAGIPFVGLMISLICLLVYIAVLILLVVTRVRLMQHAWQGVRFALPSALENMIARYY